MPILLLAGAAESLYAGTKITFVPQWTPQAQFAGYYMAKEKGFFEEEGLDVTIQHLGMNSTESVADQLFNGNAQIIGQQLLQSIIARSDGKPLLNVLQLTQVSGLWCVGQEPLSSPEDLDGKRVGRWKSGYAEFGDIIEAYTGIMIDWILYLKGINLFVFKAVDALLCYSYSEYVALKMAVGNIPENHILKFSEFGYECPEDGLYVTEEYYDAHKEEVEKFVRASKRGWDYARAHQEEALNVCMRYVDEGQVITDRVQQRLMLEEYLRLQINPVTGKADYSPVSREAFAKINDALLNTGYATRELDYDEIIR